MLNLVKYSDTFSTFSVVYTTLILYAYWLLHAIVFTISRINVTTCIYSFELITFWLCHFPVFVVYSDFICVYLL